MNEAYRAFHECKIYFNELLELKKRQLYLGESEKGTMDLMGRRLPITPPCIPKLKQNRSHDQSFE
jgi:hypothetical protein